MNADVTVVGGGPVGPMLAAELMLAVDLVTAQATTPPPAEALLVRPDGYVAWAFGPDGTDDLLEALATWFGEPQSHGAPA